MYAGTIAAAQPRMSLVAAVVAASVYAAGGAFVAVGTGPAARLAGLSEIEIGLILGAGALSGVVLAPAWGYALERWGYRALALIALPMVALGPAIMALGIGYAAALGLAALFTALFIGRLIQAAFGAALIPLAQSYVAAATDDARRVNGMSALSAALTLGAVAGTALLWITAYLGLIAGLAMLVVAGVLAFVVALLWLPAGKPQASLSRDEQEVPWRRIWPIVLITFLGYTAYTMVQPLLAFRLIDELGLDTNAAAGAAGLQITLASLAQVASQTLVATTGRWRPRPMLLFGSVGAFLGFGLLVEMNDLLAIGAVLAFIGLSLGFVVPANLTLLSLATGRGAQGKVGGINAAARGLGLSAGPIAGTVLYTAGHDLPFLAAAFLIAAVAVLSAILFKQRS